MGNESKKGWCLFFDWIDDLIDLDGEEFKTVILAINEYAKNDKKPEIKGPLKSITKFMISQMERRKKISEARAEAGRNGGQANGSKSKQNEANESKKKQNEEKENLLDKAEANESNNNNNNDYNNNNNNNNDNVCLFDNACETETSNQASDPVIFYGLNNNIGLTAKQYNELKEKYSYLNQVIDALSNYKHNNNITGIKKDYAVLSEWCEKDRARYKNRQSSFDTDEFFQAALRKSYGELYDLKNGRSG